MAWLLCSAAVRCQARRIRGLGARSPGVAAAVAVTLVGGPFAAAAGSRSVASALGAGLSEPTVVKLLIVSLATLAAGAGASLGASGAAAAGLGSQIGCAPARRHALALATAMPLLLSAAALAPLILAFLMPLAIAAPGGTSGGIALALGLAAVAAVAALVAELVVGTLRRSHLHAVCLGAGTTLAVGYGVLQGDPSRRFVQALVAGTGEAATAAVAAVVGMLGLAGWSTARGRRPAAPASRASRAPLPWRLLPLFSFALAVSVRRPDTRPALGAAALFAAAGPALALGLDVGDLGHAGSGLAPALAAAAVVPLALTGSAAAARWYLAPAPIRRRRLSGALTCASTLVVAAVATIALAVALPAGRPGVGLAGLTAAATALTVSGGLIAGVVAPWRPREFGDQLVSIIVLGGIGGALTGLTYAASHVGPTVGLAASTTGAAVPVVALGAAAVAVASRGLR